MSVPLSPAAPSSHLRAFFVPILMMLFGLSLFAGQAPESSISELKPSFARVRESIRARMLKEVIPSVSVAVAKDGKILWEESFGWADREKRIPADQHTLYALASVSKPITGTALMILQERGRLDLDRPVNDYLRGARLTSYAWDPSKATVRQIATHTAGLATFVGPSRRLSLDDTIARYGVIVRPPGESFDYSNLGYKVLDGLIAPLSGTSYADFLRSEVFSPLGMTRASAGVGPGLGDYVAAQYAGGGGQRIETDRSPESGSVYCSAHDLVQFGLFHLKADLPSQKTILSHAGIDAMQKPTATVDASHGYGLGWWVKENHFGYRVVFVHGGNFVANASLVLVPSERIAVAVLSNTGSELAATTCDSILSALLPRFREAQATRIGRLHARATRNRRKNCTAHGPDWCEPTKPMSPLPFLLGKQAIFARNLGPS
ncbi:MAG TPA: serine hydrolase domain-containing protein [Gemmataceae bacterium]|jgi:CubicO group peptidase (beta-lactamase class C family)|nr:serine hydrolase domain-containing protein [Gemmataceae bacterium]